MCITWQRDVAQQPFAFSSTASAGKSHQLKQILKLLYLRLNISLINLTYEHEWVAKIQITELLNEIIAWLWTAQDVSQQSEPVLGRFPKFLDFRVFSTLN